MKTEVKIAEFKSKLSGYLRHVRQGGEIVIKDRETPIARVLPYSPPRKRLLTIRPTRSLRDADRLPFFRPKQTKKKDVEDALKWARRDRF